MPRVQPLFFVMTLVLNTPAALCQTPPALSTGGFETPPVLKASSILAPRYRKGSRFRVNEKVHNDGYMNHFLVHSDFGDFQAASEQELLVRLNEIRALAELEKVTSSKAFAEATKKGVANIATAPVRAVKSAAEVVTDPQGTWDTVKQVPGGVARLFSSLTQKVSNGVDQAREAASGSGEGPGAAEKTIEAAGGLVNRFSGFDKRVRVWKQRLQVDPYTSNEKLLEEIKRVARIEAAVGVAFKFAPGIPGLSIISEINSYADKAKELALYEDEETLNERTRTKLRAAKATEEQIKRFEKSAAYTPSLRAFYADSLDRLRGVKDAASLIDMALQAKTSEEAAYFVRAAQQLAQYHEKERRLDRLAAAMHVPAGVTKRGHLFVPVPADYLIYTREADEVLARSRSVLQNERIKSKEIRIGGAISPLCRAKLSAGGAVVKSKVEM